VQLRKPRYGDVVEVEVERLDARGRAVGVAQHESGAYKAFVRSALPGERVRAHVIRRRRSQIDVVELETLRASPDRVDAPCTHFGACGG